MKISPLKLIQQIQIFKLLELRLEKHYPISKMPIPTKNIKHGIFVTSEDGIDEFSITSTSKVTEIKNGTINKKF